MPQYIFDPEDILEAGRLAQQAALITQEMGGILPERHNDFSLFSDILDLACGPAEWLFGYARGAARIHHPIHAIGVDISTHMIEFDLMQAQTLPNSPQFRIMDITQPLNFPDTSFDLINARFISSFYTPDLWQRLCTECRRLLKPGGLLRFTESEVSVTNSVAEAALARHLSQGMFDLGRTYSPNSFGHSAALPVLLKAAGFTQVTTTDYFLNYSYSMPLHTPVVQNMLTAARLAKPFFCSLGMPSETFDELYEQMHTQMHATTYKASWPCFTISGFSPQ